jgi:radical SAM protein with 4Fe4S-binding SPASM domain
VLRSVRIYKAGHTNFRNIGALRNYYIKTVDRPAHGIYTTEKCRDCYHREIGDCSGGCLLYKAKQLFSESNVKIAVTSGSD